MITTQTSRSRTPYPEESSATEVRPDGYNILMIRKHGKRRPLSLGEGNKEGRAR